MKRKEWEKQQGIDPLRGAEIRCPDCGRLMGYEKDYMYMVISPPGIVCPDCDEIVIQSNQVTC